ncbi:helix-turn-helix domain-containing protein [Floccifex sp.]|uniref:helix-turn-helix domain-containing protein n=1 Tax=Floccifex sp. TaxID=2815810 RepID=UPI003EFD7F27
MTYYQLLRQRRLSLNLTIEDVCSQTRLDPNFILAIEEHNLDIFANDYSFVRYFIHAYCDAIGVNWVVVQQEVDQDIHAYARSKNHAITQAQKKIASSMRPATSNKKKKNKSVFKWLSYKISGSYRFSRIIMMGAIAFVFLIVFNIFTDIMASRQQAEYERQVQEELAQKEKETEALAKQFQQEKAKKAMKIDLDDRDENIWRIYNLSETKDIHFTVDLPEESTVAIYVDDALVAGSETVLYNGTFEETVSVSQDCTIILEIGTYAQNKVTVESEDIEFCEDYWYLDTPADYTFVVEFNSDSTKQETEEELEEE